MVEGTNSAINRIKSIKETVTSPAHPFITEWRNRLMAWPNIMMGDPEKRLLGAAGVYGIRIRTEDLTIGTLGTPLNEHIRSETSTPAGRARLLTSATLAEATAFRGKASTVLSAAKEFVRYYEGANKTNPKVRIIYQPANGNEPPARWVLSTNKTFTQDTRVLEEFIRFCDMRGENPLSVATVDRTGNGTGEIFDSFYSPDGIRVNFYDTDGLSSVPLVRNGQLISDAELYHIFLNQEKNAPDAHQKALRSVTANAFDRLAWLPMNNPIGRAALQRFIKSPIFAPTRDSFLSVKLRQNRQDENIGESMHVFGTIRAVTIDGNTGEYISYNAHGQNDAGPVFDEYVHPGENAGILFDFAAIGDRLFGLDEPDVPLPVKKLFRHTQADTVCRQVLGTEKLDNPTRVIALEPLVVDTKAPLTDARKAVDQVTRRLVRGTRTADTTALSGAELKAIQKFSRIGVNPRLTIELAVLQTLSEIDAEIADVDRPITPCHHDLVSHEAALRLAVLPQVIGYQQEQERTIMAILNGADTAKTVDQLRSYVETIVVETHTMRRDFERADRPLLVHQVLREIFTTNGKVHEAAYKDVNSEKWMQAKQRIYLRYNHVPEGGTWTEQRIMDGRGRAWTYRNGDLAIHATDGQLDQIVAICIGGDHGTHTMSNSRGERTSAIAKAGQMVYPEAASLYTDTAAMFSDASSKGDGLLELTNTGADGPYRIVTAINRTTDSTGGDAAKLCMSIRRDVIVNLLNKRGISQPNETQIQQTAAEIRLRIDRAYKDVQLLFATYAELFDDSGKPKDAAKTKEILAAAKVAGQTYSEPYADRNIPRFHEPITATPVDTARVNLYRIFTSGWRGLGKKPKQ